MAYVLVNPLWTRAARCSLLPAAAAGRPFPDVRVRVVKALLAHPVRHAAESLEGREDVFAAEAATPAFVEGLPEFPVPGVRKPPSQADPEPVVILGLRGLTKRRERPIPVEARVPGLPDQPVDVFPRATPRSAGRVPTRGSRGRAGSPGAACRRAPRARASPARARRAPTFRSQPMSSRQSTVSHSVAGGPSAASPRGGRASGPPAGLNTALHVHSGIVGLPDRSAHGRRTVQRRYHQTSGASRGRIASGCHGTMRGV